MRAHRAIKTVLRLYHGSTEVYIRSSKALQITKKVGNAIIVLHRGLGWVYLTVP
jgi:hypothetical protein